MKENAYICPVKFLTKYLWMEYSRNDENAKKKE